ncbi:hypothetical protein OU426_09385 [Frigidibacter sp. RF13]|uniref:hypothetical protein n=1 Tax=Frigidibacter sp. RF13 TaxID=2997340 RepID=UPI00227105A8|nr:hypothetical protein [Frigidibacter sp. RF13]MCY1127067.1 hypothetical protein [Frigidibacter sp. RF13]
MRAPLHLWLIGGLTLFWNLVGAADYTFTQMNAAFYMAQFTPEQLAWFHSFPAWVEGAWAIAVWFSVLGSLLLLFRKGAAVFAFALSLAAMVVTGIYNFFVMSPALHEVSGEGAVAFSLAILVIGLCEWLYARRMRQLQVIG